MQSALGSVPSVLSPCRLAFITADAQCRFRRLPFGLLRSQVVTYFLLRIELDDQLLADRQRDVLTRWQLRDRAAEVLLVERDPLRHAAAIHGRERLVDPG